MAEAEEARSVGDWRCLISSPSSNSIFSSFASEAFAPASKPFSPPVDAAKNPPVAEKESDRTVSEEGSGARGGEEELCDWKPPAAETAVAARNGGSGASIAERRAARCGFNAPRLNTARFRSVSPLSSPVVRSPYLTIPPGLSPTALLDSPVMLPNSQVPSATEQVQHLPVPNIRHQNLAEVKTQADFECPVGFLNQAALTNYVSDFPEIEVSNNMIIKANYMPLQAHPLVSGVQAVLPEQQPPGEDASSQPLLEDQKGAFPCTGIGKPSEDGYNWRKYGQKQVKGSEYPRSYYKCTHPNCLVKKKVERSHDGQITEIIYKGAHHHPKPQPSRRSAIGSAFPLNETSEMADGPGSYVKVEGGSVWRSIQQGQKDKVNTEGRPDGLERTSSTSAVTELSDPLSTAHGKHLNVLESEDTLELSSTLASHEEEEDRATQGSISLGDDADDEETESKRRKKDTCLIETSLASRAVREPRVVVQTDSEVDILDDGYRWRKYGQKVVKGNPNPRSYYKCTHAGCTVRKHVERASHDLKSVITTYEGKHNHEVPAARNSNHINSGGNVSSNSQATMTLSGPNSLPKTEPQVQDIAPCFERKPDISEYLKPAFLGRFTSDLKLGPSACYQMKLPPLQPISFSSPFGHDVHQTTTISQVVPDFPLAFPLGVQRPGNFPLAGFDFNHGKPIGAALPFFWQQPKDGEMGGFVRPKQEQKDEVSSYEAHMPINHLSNSSSQIYPQVMGGFRL